MKDLLTQAYKMFSSYKITLTLDVCKVCCISDEEESLLTTTPLKELDENILTLYINSARCNTAKEQREMCYFLPRILELIVNDVYPTCCTDTLLNRLFNKEEQFIGTDKEYKFLELFFIEFWSHTLNHSMQYGATAMELLVMIGRHFDISPLLKLWITTNSQTSIIMFGDFIWEYDYNAYNLAMFSTPQIEEKIRAWLLATETQVYFTEKMIEMYVEAQLSEETKLRMNTSYILYESFVNNYTND